MYFLTFPTDPKQPAKGRDTPSTSTNSIGLHLQTFSLKDLTCLAEGPLNDMVPNPFYVGPSPDVVALCPLKGKNHELHYEIRGQGKDPKLIMIMGAMGTCRQLEVLADALRHHFEVVTYDHRNVGRSVHHQPLRSIHTSKMLAGDALELINHIWGNEQQVHVLGISMGGMVGQMLGLMLAERQRLASLSLAVTARGILQIPIPVPWWLLRNFLVPRLIHQEPADQVAAMTRSTLPEDVLNSPFPWPCEFEGRTTREALQQGFLQVYEEWFTFHDLDLCAAQFGLLASHYLTQREAVLLRKSGVPITVIAALNDRLVKTPSQFHLATVLDAHVVTLRGGHVMADPEDRPVLVSSIVAQIDKSRQAGTGP
eukprot:jgi/Botrbrau1/19340/Bobra.0073s0065.1